MSCFQFSLPELLYPLDGLEPHIDELTMKTHYNEHFNGYLTKMNKELVYNECENLCMKELISGLSYEKNSTHLINNAGGFYNHELFFSKYMSPVDEQNKRPDFITEELMDDFKKNSLSLFGSGWTWIVMNDEKKLEVMSTANQINPMMREILGLNFYPILGIDLWEHAYYLKHKNKRYEYFEDFMKVINWSKVEEEYKYALETVPNEWYTC